MPYSWNSDLKQKTGQKAKETKDDTVVDDKAIEHSLRISIEAVGDHDLESILSEIIGQTDGLVKCSLAFEGRENKLKDTLKKVATLISEQGGQQKLDLHMESASH